MESKNFYVGKKMKNTPLVITIVVMLLIGWLIYDNYSRASSQAPAPQTTKPAK